jgi:hypothetical protein
MEIGNILKSGFLLFKDEKTGRKKSPALCSSTNFSFRQSKVKLLTKTKLFNLHLLKKPQTMFNKGNMVNSFAVK